MSYNREKYYVWAHIEFGYQNNKGVVETDDKL